MKEIGIYFSIGANYFDYLIKKLRRNNLTRMKKPVDRFERCVVLGL